MLSHSFSHKYHGTAKKKQIKKEKKTTLKYVNYVSLRRVNFESLFLATKLLSRCFDSSPLGVKNSSEAIA